MSGKRPKLPFKVGDHVFDVGFMLLKGVVQSVGKTIIVKEMVHVGATIKYTPDQAVEFLRLIEDFEKGPQRGQAHQIKLKL